MPVEFPKQLKDVVYNLLQEPTLDKFRDFLYAQTGEHNSIDFKKQWIESATLAKEILALANTKGGIIVFGVAENEDNSICIDGLAEIKDKAVISNEIKNFISSNLKYEIYDFSYTTSEYEALKNKKNQMLFVDDIPKYIPFLSKKESGKLKQNMIYIRRGTSCEIANEEELHAIFSRRMQYLYPTKGEPLQLDEHLKQLRVLYEMIEKNHVYYKNSPLNKITSTFNSITNFSLGEKVVEPNPLYPDESYEQFISRVLVEKKKKIERVLDLY